jgi:hypothetical protein
MTCRAGAALACALLALTLLGTPTSVRAEGRVVGREMKRLERQMLISARLEELHEREELRARFKRRRASRAGRSVQQPARPAPEDWPRLHPRPDHDEPDGARRSREVPANVRINDRSVDVANASGQSEVTIAVLGRNLVAAWNDGEGASQGGSQLGFGWSDDGGLTWVDGGSPPNGPDVGLWLSDPVLTVDEKSGTFYFCGVVITRNALNGIAVVRGSFGSGGFAWEPPVLARIARDTLPDKPWLVADSLSGNVYLAYTAFERSGPSLSDQIELQRSTDGGRQWSPPAKLSGEEEQGLVQGARPAAGPDGELYIAWTTVDTTLAAEGLDRIQVRRSGDGGLSFAATARAADVYSNFGSGAPGFNRGYGFTWPSIAVDRSRGHHRGRVYLAWNESVNFFRDALGVLAERAEVEPNSGDATATPFVLGETLSGSLTPQNDADQFVTDGVQGQTAVFFVDSTSAGLHLDLRILCADGTTRMAYNDPVSVKERLLIVTFPENGRYYLRLVPTDANSGTYHILTGAHLEGPERGRDQRDVFINASDDGQVWSAPTRVNQDAGWFDDWLPEVAVAGDGTAYVSWMDWRGAPAGDCGATAEIYLARSDDGVDWTDQHPVTDMPTAWPYVTSNIAPNQGDYLALVVDEHAAHPAWADGRFGDPDVFTVTLPALSRVEFVRAMATADHVSLEWYAPAAGGTRATLYRRQGTEPWSTLASIASNAHGAIRYEDSDVRAGERYEYRLGVVEADGERFAGDTEVVVPAAALSLDSVRPNPADRDVIVSFSLPSPAPARLDLLDLAGRRVRSVEVPLGALGRQVVNLGAGPALPPGLYLVRLTQAGRSASSRVAIVR